MNKRISYVPGYYDPISFSPTTTLQNVVVMVENKGA